MAGSPYSPPSYREMSNCRGGIGPSMASQLSSSELLSITRDATRFFGQRANPTRFKSASEAQAYRKMLMIAAGVNGPRPVASAVITVIQAAVPCRGRSLPVRSLPVRSLPIPSFAEPILAEEEDIEGPDVEEFVEDLSVELVPLPAVPEEVAREARLDAAWTLQTYLAPVPKTSTVPSFGGSTTSGSVDIAPDGFAVAAKPFSVMNPMRALAPTA